MLQQIYGLFYSDEEWVNGRKIIAIAGLFPNDIKEKFGRYSFAYQTYRRLYVWAFEYKGETYFLETANGKGTTIYCAHIKKDDIVGFMDEILSHYTDREDVQRTLNFVPNNQSI